MKIIISGGAGFIGSKFCEFALRRGHEVVTFDNFSRPRSTITAGRLLTDYNLKVLELDLRDSRQVLEFFHENKDAELVFHLAGQVSYQASVENPRYDFETNGLGTFNMLEGSLKLKNLRRIVYSSTNKVYGSLENLNYSESATRYNVLAYENGFNENLPIHPAGPYGASKFVGEVLLKNWSDSYDLPTTTFRQSSIYGPDQFSTDDQGWLAYFVEKIARNEEYFFNGNGKQVRDLLHVEDLFEAFMLSIDSKCLSDTFNIGGGTNQSLSILELRNILIETTGNRPTASRRDNRTLDQRVFISDNSQVQQALGWSSTREIRQELGTLVEVLSSKREC